MNGGVSDETHSGWAMLLMGLLPIVVTLPIVLGNRAGLRALLVRHAATLADVALVCAGGALVMAVAAAVVAWRRAHA